MIITRAPLRISFVGGGTDLPDFSTKSPGRVLSVAINKYVYVGIKRSPLMRGVHVRYGKYESVDHPKEIQNDRVREALLASGITDNIEITTFSDFPGNTGLGSSSSFSVALMKGLRMSRGEQASAEVVAEDAATLEIDVLGEPIGKQDHYAAAFGGCNILHFNADRSVTVDPMHFDYKKMAELENHMLLFFTGTMREAKTILSTQKANIPEKFQVLTQMANMVPPFQDALEKADFQTAGSILSQSWELKKQLAPAISNPTINSLYRTGMVTGAYGGKLLGAGGGGCILFLARPQNHDDIRKALKDAAVKEQLADFMEVPVGFNYSGVEVLLNNVDTA